MAHQAHGTTNDDLARYGFALVSREALTPREQQRWSGRLVAACTLCGHRMQANQRLKQWQHWATHFKA